MVGAMMADSRHLLALCENLQVRSDAAVEQARFLSELVADVMRTNQAAIDLEALREHAVARDRGDAQLRQPPALMCVARRYGR
jgi:hypothetical protein